MPAAIATAEMGYPTMKRIAALLLVMGLVVPSRPAIGQNDGAPLAAQSYSESQLQQMVAPIALYPDSLETR